MSEKPWGRYEDLYRSENLVLKKITVNPKSRLSLQSHENRMEYWIVVKGNCICEKNSNDEYDNNFSLTRMYCGDTIEIHHNDTHRLINDGTQPCEIIELQYGICDEEDIFRYEDDYNRQIKGE